MEHPRIGDLETLALAGSGPCGSVYKARDAEGNVVALKVFQGEAINRRQLEEATKTLESSDWPRGVMPVLAADFQGSPPKRLTPWMSEIGDNGEDVARNLQHRFGRFPSSDSWRVLRELAEVLATFHCHGVAHANLKPGNVFFDKEDRVVLTDWALGNMPGVRRLEFTDAYLYQPPEQLRDPGGYPHGAGFHWDVFAFGVLAFQLLTGRFPRCHETFALLMPGNAEHLAEGVHTDVERVARRLEEHAGIHWPEEPRNSLEAGWHGWITRCLAIDASLRPATMMEVARGLARIDEHAAAEATCDAALDQRRHAERSGRRAKAIAVLTGLLAIGAAGYGTRLWWNSQQLGQELTDERKRGQETTALAEQEIFESNLSRDQALARAREIVSEHEQVMARLTAAQSTADRLFSWAMEQDVRQLPPLDGREARLRRLERHFEEFLKTTETTPSFAGERGRALLALAEIALSRGDAGRAGQKLDQAIGVMKNQPLDAELRLRLATNRLRLALRLQENGDAKTMEAFAFARQDLNGLPKAEIDGDRVGQLLAVLDFQEAKVFAARGEEAKALEQSMRATQALNRLAERRPDVVLLRSAMADSYLSAAAILEGMGSFGDAQEVRIQATGLLVKLVEQNPRDIGLRLELAGCYGAIAQAALKTGDAASAELQNSRAIALLEAVSQEQPQNGAAMLQLGIQMGTKAALRRDRGQTEESMKLLDEGIRLLDAARALDGSKVAAFRIALLQWQKGGMLGTSDESRNQALGCLLQARDALKALESAGDSPGVTPEQIRRSLAYLLGDLGNAQLVAKKPEEAKRAFIEAVAMWERLTAARPKNPEYEEGLSWSKRRLEELQ
jgi:serine/threonine protein kinase